MTREPANVTPVTKPRLSASATLRYDDRRRHWVLLGPERVLIPDETAREVLQRCDGSRRVKQIVDEMTALYAAPRTAIADAVAALLQELGDKGLVDV